MKPYAVPVGIIRVALVLLWLTLPALCSNAQQFTSGSQRNPLRDEPAGDTSSTINDARKVETQATAGANGSEVPQEYTQEQIDEMRSRVGELPISEAEKADANKFYQDALNSTTALDATRDSIRKLNTEYDPVEDPEHPNSPEMYSKQWYEYMLSLPITQVIDLQPVDLKADETDYLEEQAAKCDEEAKAWNRFVSDLQAEPSARKQFLASLPSARQTIGERLSETTEALEAITTDGVKNQVTEARRVALVQQAAKLNADLQELEARQGAYERAELVYDVELELAKRKAAAYSESLTAIRAELAERRRRVASEQAQAAEQEARRNRALIERNPNSLGALAHSNQALTKELQELVDELAQLPRATDAQIRQSNTIDADLKQFKEEYGDDSNLSQASGELLRDQRAKLPRRTPLRAEILRRTNQKRDISSRRFVANQRINELENLDAEVARVLSDVRADDRAAAQSAVQKLLASRQKYLKNYVEHLDKLEVEIGKLIGAKEQLLRNTQQFLDFIAERDLWIRSCMPLWARKVEPGQQSHFWRPFYYDPALGAFAWSFRPENWVAAASDLKAGVAREPLLAAMLLATFLLLIYAQRKARKQIQTLGDEATKKTCTEFVPSLRTLWLTIVVSLPWPLFLWGIGWMLDGLPNEAEFTRAQSTAIREAAWLLLLAEFMRQCCRMNGLADAHLGWPRAALAQLRRHLRWVPVFVMPLVFWLVALDVQSTQPLWSASLGRVLYLMVMAYSAVALWRLLMTKSSAIYQALDRGSENWLLRLHRGWRPILVVLPIALAAMATLGYYYTAQQLTQRVLSTAAMLLSLMIAGGLLRRWVLLNRRHLAREQARQRRAQAQAQATDAEGEHAFSLVDVPEEVVDLTALSEATRKLLRFLLLVVGVIGTAMIWQDVFPALAWLDKNALPWLSGDDPATWGSLLRATVALLITYVAVRDLPSLLELVVLQHLPIDQGVRYATSTLVRYSLLGIGIVVAANLIGISATSISWLVAAMGVGLGFGLQEIFANFVSGVILLFERPIRVGDIITLGDTTGVVNRIRMRATTIVDWDRKEYVVPNKDLVTGRLLNWTLTDQTNRIVIPVGVAYGTDTDRACSVLRQAIHEHPHVLEDPAPLITFEGFGDNTLNLIVRCYLPNLDNRLSTIHELHTNIHRAFNDAGIEIAFPQRDLHIRSMPPGWELRAPANKAATNSSHEQPQRKESNN